MSHTKLLLVSLATCAFFTALTLTDPAFAQGRRRGQSEAQGRGRGQAAAPQGRGTAQPLAVRQGALNRQMPRGYQESAFARGYADGYRRGRADGKRRERYDPADSADYRNGDQGYTLSYGSRDAYRSNYRAGFRQGYEEGYREATR